MPTYTLCPPRKAQGTQRGARTGYCGALRGDGTASRKAQSRARHNFQCAKFAPVTSGVTLVKIGPRVPKLGMLLAQLQDKFNQ